jgi:plasmid replication initiation protein
MARKSKKVELRKQEIASVVPVDQLELMIQPITFAYLNGDMSVMHARINTVIMEKLQQRIAKTVAKRHEEHYTGSLFSDEDFAPLKGVSGNYIPFTVKYSELGVTPSNYKYVSEAARAMQGSAFYEREIDGYVRSIMVFPVVDVPDETKKERRTDMKFYMTESTALYLFTFAQYQKFLKEVIFNLSSSYSVRIYLLINANKYKGTWEIEYDKLRKLLLTTKNEKTGKYECTKYRDINDFKKRVLEVARKEIAEAPPPIDCTFDYEFRYPAGKRRGTPEAIIFHIHLTDTGRAINQQQQEVHEAIGKKTHPQPLPVMEGSSQTVEDAEAVEVTSEAPTMKTW